ncbi:MAG: ABC transporter ATP-binding protein [bacterium]|nr:ABC transporter ATP-binding protein [bacterium]
MPDPETGAYLGSLEAIARPGLTPIERLRLLMKPEHDQIGVIVIYAAVGGLLSLGIPLAVQSIVNTIAFENLLQPMVWMAVVLFLALGFGGVLQALQNLVVESMQQRWFVRVSMDLARRIPGIRLDAFDGEHGPELVNRFFSVFILQKASGTLLLDGLGLVLQVGLGLFLMAVYHPVLFQLDLVLVVAIAFVLFVLGRHAISTALGESKSKYAMAAWLEELARHPVTFRFGDAARRALAQADVLALEYVERRRAHHRVVFRQLIAFLALQAMASSALLGVGGWLVVQRQLSLGQLIASEFVVTSVVAALVKLVKHLETYYDLLAAVDKLGALVELPAVQSGGFPLPRTPGPAGLKVIDLVAGFPDHPGAIEGIELDLPPGSRTAILGINGGGKSLLADLLVGLREPDRGHVEIDDHDLRDVEHVSLHRQVALVRPEEVVAGTVMDNLRLWREDVTPSEARHVLDTVGLWDEVRALPSGLDTELSTGGYPLSPREAARLVLARALAARPRLLVVDEALDGLDLDRREAIVSAFVEAGAPWTLVVLTQNPEIAARCQHTFKLAPRSPGRGSTLSPITVSAPAGGSW